MSETTSNDECAEAQEHPVERYVPPSANEVNKSKGDRQVRQKDQSVGNDVQPDQLRVPHVAVDMRHEVLTGNKTGPKQSGCCNGGYDTCNEEPDMRIRNKMSGRERRSG